MRYYAFQSSPTPRGGRYAVRRDLDGREIQFQSSPTPRGGRYHMDPEKQYRVLTFQSSPTPRGGRYLAMAFICSSLVCFNPRPPLEVGATGVRPSRWLHHLRFNPRPPLEVGATWLTGRLPDLV